MDKRDDKDLNYFYLSAFPTAQRVEFCENMTEQRRGVDKIIHFPNGRTVTVDEKKRRKDYGDILLELWSRYEEKKLGWLFYSQCDYIVYAVLEVRKIYLLPLLLLQTAWSNNKVNWLRLYEQKPAKNKNYTTINIPIPTQELLNAIRTEMERNGYR